MAWRSISLPLLLLFVLVLLAPAPNSGDHTAITLAHAADADAPDAPAFDAVDDDDDEEDDDDDDEFDDDDDEGSVTPPADANQPVVIDPEGQENASGYVTPDSSGASFFDDFQDGLAQWAHTSDPEYTGAFVIGQGATPPFSGDRAMIVPEKAKKYGISAKIVGFEDISDQDLVLQYELRLDQGMTCGGAYFKLPTTGFVQEAFNGDTKYSIMFGPDKCGSTDKVHFIFQSINPVTGEMKEHHLKAPPSVANSYDKKTHLYGLHVAADGKIAVYVDGEKKKEGTLSESFEPPVQPPQEIDDPEDKKPADWVDQAKIPDPDAEKPDEWDEDAPKEIVDAEAEKPEGWLDDEPLQVADPDAKKPDEWDDAEDGDWEAPTVANPKCADIGCGDWTPPMKSNPDFKGKWAASLVDNPKYIGQWKPKKIPNKEYYEVPTPKLLPILGLGVEIWTMDQAVLFDNVWLGSDMDAATKFADATFKLKQKEEIARDEAENAKREKESKNKKSDKKKPDTKLGVVMEKIEDVVDKVEQALEPVEAYIVKAGFEKYLDKLIDMGIQKPMLVVVSVPLLVVVFFLLILGGSKSTPAASTEEAEKKKTDEATADDEVKAEGEAEGETVESESTATHTHSHTHTEKNVRRRRPATAE